MEDAMIRCSDHCKGLLGTTVRFGTGHTGMAQVVQEGNRVYMDTYKRLSIIHRVVLSIQESDTLGTDSIMLLWTSPSRHSDTTQLYRVWMIQTV